MLCMNADRARLKHLQNNGHVSLTVLGADDFGTHVSVQGHVVSIKPDEGLADIDRLSRHFLGKDYPARENPLVTVHVAIDRWFVGPEVVPFSADARSPAPAGTQNGSSIPTQPGGRGAARDQLSGRHASRSDRTHFA